MPKQEFKFIKGKCQAGVPADIYFYTDVDYWSVDNFIWEFNHLVNHVGPSKIRIHINSAGGSCVEGMSVFSKIMDCQIPTETINDGLAASMGSIIWAAGDELYMKDYALLMIHNPFCGSDDKKEYNQVSEAFTQQLKIVYSKRFGMSDEEIQAIMDGKDGDDGTFLTASQAVEKGFVSANHIIETPAAVHNHIRAALDGVKDMAKIKAVLALAVSTPEPKHVDNFSVNNNINMDKNEITVFAALLGLSGEKATVEHVSASINELKAQAAKIAGLQASLDETKALLTKAQAELTGSQTSVNNLTADLDKCKGELQAYKDAEASAKAAKVKALIDKAIADCKINKDEEATYTKIAQDNFDLAESILAKIPARDHLGNVIAQANEKNAQEGMLSEQEKVNAKVDEVVGKDFAFRKLD